MERLDRFVVNSIWIDSFPSFRVDNMDYSKSNHRPIKVSTNQSPITHTHFTKRRFTFEHKWILEENFADLVWSLWISSPDGVSFTTKLDILASSLTECARDKVGVLTKEIKITRECLNKILNDERKPYNAEVISNMESHLEKLLDQEETHWKQRSRNQWLFSIKQPLNVEKEIKLITLRPSKTR